MLVNCDCRSGDDDCTVVGRDGCVIRSGPACADFGAPRLDTLS